MGAFYIGASGLSIYFANLRAGAGLERAAKSIESFFVRITMHFVFILVCGISMFGCNVQSPPRERAALPNAPAYAPTIFSNAPAPTPNAPSQDNAPRLTTRIAARTPIVLKTPVRDRAALETFRRGFAYVAVKRAEYSSAASQRALDEMFVTGANSMSILVTWYQDDLTSTEIAPRANSPSDEEIAFVIAYAHARGVRVLLKPQLDVPNHAQWRGSIAPDDERAWQAWFASYQKFILNYARLAQANGVEEFAVGTELAGTSARTDDWRALIRAVRAEYTGLVTYAANHSGEELAVQFWDDLDFIGVNAFYHLTNYRAPTLQDILDGWTIPIQRLETLHQKFPDRPIVFTEVGYRSLDRANIWPWEWQRADNVDLHEQALLYQALFETWWYPPQRAWFRGMYIWNWLPDPNQGGPDDTDYTPHNKPAQEILKRYYLSDDNAAQK